ncbi:SDR family oxidoreductase [Nocardioides sp. AX2bis]|uniref:SDR family oxidoreductase n=1 Tax=Nocardioides sp. AX2bis TaxID=2653157 RepID=UPI0012EFA70A|nr:NAD(P)H-binding protein [Nocardioides sp. AX2bis]VXB09956.1 Hydroxylase [Nocardioides sp. AX2bis]
MTYLVHGASGAQGSPVLSALRASGHQAVAAVRDPTSIEGPAVAVDYDSVDSLVAAYRETSGVFVHLPVGSPQRQAEVAGNVAAALARSGVNRVVMSTSGYPLEDGSGPAVLATALEAGGQSFAVLEPRLFLENLLLPPVVGPARTEGVLRYPVRAHYPISWVSHLDVADAAVALLIDGSITGRVTVGALPALLGSDLADGFSTHLGTPVSFEAQDPEDFGRGIIPMFGEQAARPVIDSYVWRQTQVSDVIDEERSAQRMLGMVPRTVAQWLADAGA